MVYEGWARGCDNNTSSIFTSSNTSSVHPREIGPYRAYACRRNGSLSVLYHTLWDGVQYAPHTINTTLPRLKFVGNGNGCTSQATYVDSTNSSHNALVYQGCSIVGNPIPVTGSTSSIDALNAAALASDLFAPQWPVGGFSAVEGFFWSPVLGGGNVYTRVTESDMGVGQVYGLAVSLPLYRAIQATQNLSDVNTSSFDPINAPNITKAQAISLITSGGAMAGDWTPLLGNNPGVVNIMRRADTSATQVSSNAFFLQNPCLASVASSRVAATSADSYGNYQVFMHSGSTNVKTALTSASSSAIEQEKFAIGVLSLVNDWRTDDSTMNGYRYVKIDGVHPESGDLLNARLSTIDGSYPFHMEMKSFVRNNYAGKPTKTSFEAAVIDQITQRFQKPPTSLSCQAFPRGLTLNPLNGSTCIFSQVISKVTNLGKNCAHSEVVF